MNSETTRAYCAGIIDGEGSIIINSRRHHSSVIVQVGNTDPEMIDFLEQSYGGGVCTYKNPKKSLRIFFMWTLHSKQAEFMIREILPYLITKKKHALVALRLRDIINSRTPVGTTRRLTEIEKQERFKCFSELKEINHKRQGILLSDLKYNQKEYRNGQT